MLAAQFLKDGHLQGTEKAKRAGSGDAIAIQEGPSPVKVEVEGGRGGGVDLEDLIFVGKKGVPPTLTPANISNAISGSPTLDTHTFKAISDCKRS